VFRQVSGVTTTVARGSSHSAGRGKAAKLGVKMTFPIVFCFMPVPAIGGLAEVFG